MSKALKHVQHLASEIGPRGSTSDEERKASSYVVEFFRSQGVDVSQQIFSSPTTWSWTNFTANLIVLFGVATYLYVPLLAVFLAGLGLSFNILENDNRNALSRLMPRKKSQNVIGKAKAGKATKKQVVLVAHIDSSRADYAHHPNRVSSFRKLYLLNTAFPVLILTIYSAGAVLDLTGTPLPPYRWDWLVSLLLAVPVLFVMVLLVLRQLWYGLVSGANDNASGVSVILELMAHFAREPLWNTEITAVLTGCEEVVCNGMISFLEEFGKSYREAFFINIDNCGAGMPVYASVEGMLFPHKSDQELLRLARQVQKENPELKIAERPFRSGYTDGSAAMVRGYKVLSFLALNEKGVPPNWHWYTDTLENVQVDNLAVIETFVRKLLEVIDRD
ncbi:MAG: M28 family peptidase [Candidatus Odinarchaeota archaeon]